MENYPRLAPVAYTIALLLVAIPIFDSAMSVAPFHPGNAQWRFGFFGLMSNALLIPTVGVLLAVVAALTYEHEGAQKALWVGSWLMAVLLLIAMVAFSLDSLQTRSHVRPEVQASFVMASVTGLLKLLATAVVFGLFGWAIPGAELFNFPEFRFRRS